MNHFNFIRPVTSVGALLCVFALLSVPAFASAQKRLTPHTAEYKIKVSVLSGKLRTVVKSTDSGYSADSVLQPGGFAKLFVRGDVTERSTFAIVDNTVRPLHYSSADKISKKDKFMQFDFDWERKRVSGSVNDADVEFELDGRVHDRVSIQYELMLDLMNGRTSDEYSLLDDDELKQLQITNIGEKSVKVPFGRFQAIGIQHRKAESDRVTTLWCVEELGYLPVLIEQHRGKKLAVRAQLTKYSPTEL